MSNPTASEFDAAVTAAEQMIAVYEAEKAALVARRSAGELSYPATEKARLAASVLPCRAKQAVEALADRVDVASLPIALLERAEKVCDWRAA